MLSALTIKSAASGLSISLRQSGSTLINQVPRMSAQYTYETLAVSVPHEYVYHVELNRPEKLNAMNNKMWMEYGHCFDALNADKNCRAIVLSARGKLFSAGIDFKDLMNLAPEMAKHDDVARKAKVLYNVLVPFQKSISAAEQCKKPVISAIHGACIGAGLDMITATDIRYCTKDSWFSVKEVDIGMAADVGVLQRFPKIVGCDSLVRELCYTARKFPAEEARSLGLISRIFEDKESLMKGALDLAVEISKKSPVGVQVTKASLVYSRDHSVEEGLAHIALYNQLMLQSEDLSNATIAQATKQKNVVFAKL